MFHVPEGCVVYPADRLQALCMQHIVGETSIGGMALVTDLTLNSEFTRWWNGPKLPRRTKAEVQRQRETPGGCCERFCDNMACDCMEEAT